MATPPTFSAGAVLTAAQMNKIGLYLVTTVTPTPSTVLAIDDCFTSDYSNYTIIVTPVALASTGDINLRLRSGGSPNNANYYMANLFVENTSVSALAENNTGSWRVMNIGTTTTTINSLKFDLYGPAVVANTRYQMNSEAWSGTTIRYRSGVGFHDSGNAFDGFELVASSNITATISVYGYNKG
jgi:hypothetical protein